MVDVMLVEVHQCAFVDHITLSFIIKIFGGVKQLDSW